VLVCGNELSQALSLRRRPGVPDEPGFGSTGWMPVRFAWRHERRAQRSALGGRTAL